jgi:hemerythrin superfamily protein
MNARTPDRTIATQSPIDSFSQCHAGIVSRLQAFAELPGLVAAAERARQVAASTLATFDPSVPDHHKDEEAELFPAVLHSAAPGEEHARVAAIVDRLVAEHRAIEALWKEIKPSLRSAAAGRQARVDEAAVAELVRAYTAHARFEETQLLPLAEEILGRNDHHMAALGLSLHMRHAPNVVGYI